jgi:hypothetical protein
MKLTQRDKKKREVERASDTERDINVAKNRKKVKTC